MYNSVKDHNPVVINPYSTGLTLQLIPKAAVDKIPGLSMAYGLSASADGNDFPWISTRPITIGTARRPSSAMPPMSRAALTSSRARKSASSISTRPMAENQFRCCKRSTKDYGFSLKLYPVEASQMQNQSSLWLDVRRDRPDWIYVQGWGAMNPTAVRKRPTTTSR